MNMMCASRVIAGVVHEDVDRPELAARRDSKNAVTSASSPTSHRPAQARPPRAAHAGDELRGRRVLLAIRDGDRRAALGQELGDAAADAARPAGDDGDTAVELKIVEGHGLTERVRGTVRELQSITSGFA